MKLLYKLFWALTLVLNLYILVFYILRRDLDVRPSGQSVTLIDGVCQGSLRLTTDIPLPQLGEPVNNLFFLETSGRSTLDSRQACAIESAARMSEMNVIVTIRNETLSLDSNVTCQLYKHYSNIQFYR